MRIGMIGHKRVPTRDGGIEVVVMELASRMAEWGHSVMLYNRYYGGEKLTRWRGCKVTEVPTPPWEKSYSVPWYVASATLSANKKGYDILHFHAEGPCIMIPFAKLFKKTCVATIHGLDWKRAKWGKFASMYLRMGERIAARFADRLIVLSKYEQDYFKEEYGRNAVLIPNGVTRKPVREAKLIKSELGLEKDHYILYLARIVPEKCLDLLLEAYRQIDTDIPLVVAGPLTPSSAYLRKIQKMAKSDPRVKLIGFVKGRLLEELYSNCRVYVLPSELEGLPMSLLEAINYHAPCLVSDIPSCKEVAPDYTKFFHNKDVADLRDKLRHFVNEPCVRATDEEVDRVLKDYDWDVIARKTLKTYIRARKV